VTKEVLWQISAVHAAVMDTKPQETLEKAPQVTSKFFADPVKKTDLVPWYGKDKASTALPPFELQLP